MTTESGRLTGVSRGDAALMRGTTITNIFVSLYVGCQLRRAIEAEKRGGCGPRAESVLRPAPYAPVVCECA